MHFACLLRICPSNHVGALLWSARLINGLAAASEDGRENSFVCPASGRTGPVTPASLARTRLVPPATVLRFPGWTRSRQARPRTNGPWRTSGEFTHAQGCARRPLCIRSGSALVGSRARAIGRWLRACGLCPANDRPCADDGSSRLCSLVPFRIVPCAPVQRSAGSVAGWQFCMATAGAVQSGAGAAAPATDLSRQERR